MLLIVHGGIGEDGTLQSLLDAEGVPYTGLFIIQDTKDNYYLAYIILTFFPFAVLSSDEGPGAVASKICMDKVATSLALKHVCCPVSYLFFLKDIHYLLYYFSQSVMFL